MPSSPTMLSLAELKAGEHAILHEIHTGKGVTSRLSTLGFTPGVEIEMIQNYGHGPLVVGLRGTRVALGRQEASKAMVSRRTA